MDKRDEKRFDLAKILYRLKKGEKLNLIGADFSDGGLQCINLSGASLQKINLSGADLLWSNLSGAHLANSDLSNANLISADLKGANLYGADIRGANLYCADISKVRVNNIKYNKKTIFRGIRGLDSCYGSQEFKTFAQDQDYIEEFKENHKFIHGLWSVTSDCGRSMLRWTSWSCFIALYFSVIFFFIGSDSFIHDESLTWDLMTTTYYSVVTFTTLGFGDITPKSYTAMFYVALEVIIGYIMLGGLISLFSNKIAKRS